MIFLTSQLSSLRRELAVTYKRAGLPQKLEHLVLENHEIKLKETGTLDQFARLAELTLTIPLTVS